jgi:hypothetical protein
MSECKKTQFIFLIFFIMMGKDSLYPHLQSKSRIRAPHFQKFFYTDQGKLLTFTSGGVAPNVEFVKVIIK